MPLQLLLLSFFLEVGMFNISSSSLTSSQVHHPLLECSCYNKFASIKGIYVILYYVMFALLRGAPNCILIRKYWEVDVGVLCSLLAATGRSKTLFNIVWNSNSDRKKENSGTITYIISPSTGNIILASNLLYLAPIRGNSSKHKWFCFLRFKINSSLVWKFSQNLHRNPWLSAFHSTCILICPLLLIGFAQ